MDDDGASSGNKNSTDNSEWNNYITKKKKNSF